MSSYAAATSASMSAAVRAAVAARPGFTIETAAEITEVGTHHVVLRDGRRCDASWIIDARGPAHVATDVTACGYQVFVGLEIQLAAPHGLLRPILMDARLPQSAGYRFMYVLPLNEQRVLIEDTYFSDSPMFDETALVAGILRYAADRGLRVSRVVRSERGVLPLPLTLPARPARWGTHAIVAGYQGGWFHPTTGYSFPVALRVAQFLATSADQPDAATRWRRLTRDHRRQQRFAVLLNRMLFRWFPPHQRHNVFSRFYRLPLATIGRFYALRMTFGDRARMFLGRPPRGLGWRAALSGKVAV